MTKEAIPENIVLSNTLDARHIELLLTTPELPVIDPAFYDERLKNIFQYYSINPEEMEKELHLYAKELLDEGKTREAWQVLLSIG